MLDDKTEITIGTHNGTFHPDDVFAVATLFLYFKDKKITVVRTRDEILLDHCDIVVDVGSRYEPHNYRFDHHQGNVGGHSTGNIPYASFGLVWRHFGKEVCRSQTIADQIEKELVVEIDADDNGILIYEPKDNLTVFTVGEYILHQNGTWQENETRQDEKFLSCVAFAQSVIERELFRVQGRLQAVDPLSHIYQKTEDKRILVLDGRYPTGDFLEDKPEVLFVVSPDKVNGDWTASSPSKQKDTFENRALFPESWAGLRNEALEQVCGIKGAVFCHKGRFFAVAKTKEAVLRMAHMALGH